MTRATLSAKGQITIPKRVREALGLTEGDEVVVAAEGDHLVMYPVRRRDIRELHGVFAGRRPYPGREVEREAAMQQAAREALGLADDEG